jgi:cephalosporin hydroxylase
MQKDAELASFAALVLTLQPKVIVEIGSDAGGTLWLWQQLCPRVIGVTLEKAWVGVWSTGRDLDDHGCEMIMPEIQVSRFWNTLDGDKEEIVARRDITGYGIGVLRIPANERISV